MAGLVPKGNLLIANPAIYERNFHRTLVLVMDHGDDGAVGVILNRPSDTPVGEVLPMWRSVASTPEVMFVGGPVTPQGVLGVARGTVRGDVDAEGWSLFWGDLATVDLDRDPLDFGVAIDDLRLFVGYSGWSAGQLEDELDRGLWLVVEGTPADVFDPDPDNLWRKVLGRQRGPRQWLANFPLEPSLN